MSDNKRNKQQQGTDLPEERKTLFTGILEEDEGGGSIETTGKGRVGRVRIPQSQLNGAPFGMRVVIRLTTAEGITPILGRVEEVLGDPARPDTAILAIIREHGLRDEFPEDVIEQAEQIPRQLSSDLIYSEIAAGRRDLRSLETITIDGKDARDLDDAISCMEQPEGGWRLWVHIADVSYYVPEDSPMDLEARERGNSVYLVDRVLPMLPPRLSNGICSLNPDAERLTLTCEMVVTADGRIEDETIYESVIRSDLRANYTDAWAYLSGEEAPAVYGQYGRLFKLMYACSEALSARRKAEGEMEFDFPETHVKLDRDGHPIDIYAYPINPANGIIEQFMIAANIAVARTYRKLDAPFLYRVHELPDPVRLKNFTDTARLLGVKIDLHGSPTSSELNEILMQVKDTRYEAVLSQLLLQSLAKARYSEEPLGHYGLGLEDYTHFTSPIRRYPDLFIHRVIKGFLHDNKRLKQWHRLAPAVAEHCSDTEREATYAEYDTVDQKVAEYMADRVGEQYPAVISGMIGAGMFVQLENTVEGMIPFRTMDDYMVFDEQRLTATGSHNRKVYHIGQEIEVMVARADVVNRQVDFVLPEDFAEYRAPAWTRERPQAEAAVKDQNRNVRREEQQSRHHANHKDDKRRRSGKGGKKGRKRGR